MKAYVEIKKTNAAMVGVFVVWNLTTILVLSILLKYILKPETSDWIVISVIIWLLVQGLFGLVTFFNLPFTITEEVEVKHLKGGK